MTATGGRFAKWRRKRQSLISSEITSLAMLSAMPELKREQTGGGMTTTSPPSVGDSTSASASAAIAASAPGGASFRNRMHPVAVLTARGNQSHFRRRGASSGGMSGVAI